MKLIVCLLALAGLVLGGVVIISALRGTSRRGSQRATQYCRSCGIVIGPLSCGVCDACRDACERERASRAQVDAVAQYNREYAEAVRRSRKQG